MPEQLSTIEVFEHVPDAAPQQQLRSHEPLARHADHLRGDRGRRWGSHRGHDHRDQHEVRHDPVHRLHVRHVRGRAPRVRSVAAQAQPAPGAHGPDHRSRGPHRLGSPATVQAADHGSWTLRGRSARRSG